MNQPDLFAIAPGARRRDPSTSHAAASAAGRAEREWRACSE